MYDHLADFRASRGAAGRSRQSGQRQRLDQQHAEHLFGDQLGLAGGFEHHEQHPLLRERGEQRLQRGTGIVIINQIEPIAVTFTVPQGDFQRLSDLSDNFRKPLATVATSQETGAQLGNGELSIADNRVDATTGSVELKARFENPGRRLWPGQFVNVTLTLQTLPHVTTIPATAVNQGPNGAFAYVVGPGAKAVMRPIKVAWTEGSTAVIQSGVQPGDVVVTTGK